MVLPLLMAAAWAGGGTALANVWAERNKDQAEAKRLALANSVLSQYYSAGGPGEQLEKMVPGTMRGAIAQVQAGGDLDEVLKGLESLRVQDINRTEDQGIAANAAKTAQGNSDRSYDLNADKFDYQRKHDAQVLAQQERTNAIAAGTQITPAEQYKRTIDLQDQMRSEYNTQITVHTKTQQAYQQFLSELDGGTDASLAAATIKLANILDPDSVVRDEERKTWIGRGGLGNNIASSLNDITAGGSTPKTRQLLKDTALRAYRPIYESGKRVRETYSDRIRELNQQWGTAIAPNQVLGGTGYDAEFDPGKPALSQVEKDRLPTPEGYTDTPPAAQGWWQQLLQQVK